LWMGQGDGRRLVGMAQLFDQLPFLTESYRLERTDLQIGGTVDVQSLHIYSSNKLRGSANRT
jgi:hypothetical protein